MGRGTRAALATVMAAVAVGCSGSDSEDASLASDESPTTTQATTTTPSTTTTTAVPPTPGQMYLFIVKESNCLQARTNAALDRTEGANGYFDSSDWPAIQAELLPRFRDAAEAKIRFYQAIIATEWPADVQADMDALVAESTTEAAYFQRISESTSTDDMLLAMNNAPENRNTAGVVRAKLGLESNVVDDTDFCIGIP